MSVAAATDAFLPISRCLFFWTSPAQVADDSFSSKGFPGTMYGVSKALEAAYSRILAKELAPRGITVSAMCPGYCATNMSSWRGTKVTLGSCPSPPLFILRLLVLTFSGLKSPSRDIA